jgi:hypothetical protein
MPRKLAPLALALCLPLFPKAPMQQVQVVTTDRVDFAAGGTIRLDGTEGQLNIEGWDQPQVQIVLTRFDYADATDKDKDRVKGELERITIKSEKRSGAELSIATLLPHRNFFTRQVRGRTGAGMNYRIMVPKDSHLIIHHGDGDVVLYNVGGDIDASARLASILLQLEDPAHYAIDARCKVGDVYSEYEGAYRTPFRVGEGFTASAQPPAHKVFLRVRMGGIKIVKMGPNPLAEVPK